MNSVNQNVYHQVLPENVKDSYGEYDTIDFSLTFENRALVCNSIRLEGDLEVLNNSNPLCGVGGVTNDGSGTAQDVFIDPMSGAHVVLNSVVSSFQNVGVIENLTEYSRYVKMNTIARKSRDDMLMSDSVCEMRSPDRIFSNALIQPRVPADYGGGGTDAHHIGSAYGRSSNINSLHGGVANNLPSMKVKPSFSIKPHLCLNKVSASGSPTLSYTKSGAVKLSFNLARNLEVLVGQNVDTNYSYNLSNIKICFRSVPDMNPKASVLMNTTLCLKSSLNSAFSNTSSKVPAVCNAVSVVFLNQNHEYQPNFNNQALEEPPNIKDINYIFNDSTNQYISYQIDERVEMIQRGLESLDFKTSANVSLDLLSANKSFILGINFNTDIDLSSQKFNLQMNSDISNANPFLMYQYFHSQMNI